MRIPPVDRSGIKSTEKLQDRVERDAVAHVGQGPQQQELLAADDSAKTRPRMHWWQRLFRS